MISRALFLTSLVLVVVVRSEILEEEFLTTSTQPPPPRPYFFSYAAGRYPGHVDRKHTEVSDGSGVVKGSFAYEDPNHHIRTVDYVADREGFHPVLNENPPEHPAESAAVQAERNRHLQLYAKIAEDHATHPHPNVGEIAFPRQSAAVEAAAEKHLALFRVIAEQHARIAAEREALQKEEEEKEHLQLLQEEGAL